MIEQTPIPAIPDGVQLVLRIAPANWLNSNQRLHPQAKAKRTRTVRRLAYATAKRNHTPALTPPVQLYARIGNLTRGKFDPANAYPTIKAALDGLIDAGLLPDDNSDMINAVTITRAPKETRKNYELTLTLVPYGSPSYVPF